MTTPVAAIVQARMSSTRLPGKVLLPLAGEPVVVRIVERLERAVRVSKRVVATSIDPSDDELARTCESRGIDVVRGPLDDVLGRFVVAAPEDCPVVVRITADCPLVDPALVDLHVARFLEERTRVDYVTNAVVRTQPDGLDVEVVSREILLEAYARARSADDREHVLPWVRRHARLVHVTQAVDLSALRWTLDTRVDYEVLAEIYDELHSVDGVFTTRDVYELLVRRPELIHLAAAVKPTDVDRQAWVRRIEQHLAAEHDG